jgi:hypothetical protein
MSSWAGQRVHFRERRNIPLRPNIEPIPQNLQVTPIVQEPPSKYVTTKNVNGVAICAIALNEERYIDEWIKYHLALGFKHIFIYDNSKDNSLKNRKSEHVTIIHFPGTQQQLPAYDIFVRTYKNKYKWAAFIDCDEFIFLKNHNNISDFLNEYDDFSGISLNWLFFGTSNEKAYRDEPVTKRFRYCSNKLDRQIKCIVKINLIDRYVSPHYPNILKGTICNINKNTIVGPYNEDFNSDVAYIHHYYTKSEEEFKEKIARGKADLLEKRSLDELNNIHDLNNEIINTTAWDFYSKHCLPS